MPIRYSRASLEYSWRASAPLLVQTIAILGIVLSLGRVASRASDAPRSGRPRHPHPAIARSALGVAGGAVRAAGGERAHLSARALHGRLAHRRVLRGAHHRGRTVGVVDRARARGASCHPSPATPSDTAGDQDRLGAIRHEAPSVHALIVVGDVGLRPSSRSRRTITSDCRRSVVCHAPLSRAAW